MRVGPPQLKACRLVDRSVIKIPTSLLSNFAAILSKLVFMSYPVSEREQVKGSGARAAHVPAQGFSI